MVESSKQTTEYQKNWRFWEQYENEQRLHEFNPALFEKPKPKSGSQLLIHNLVKLQ